MTPTIDITTYRNIANEIYNVCGQESGSYEIEYTTDNAVLFFTVEAEIEYREVLGGSYEGWDWERLSEVAYERYDIMDFGAYDLDGNEIEYKLNETELTNLLN